MRKIYMVISLILTAALLNGCYQFMPAPNSGTEGFSDASSGNSQINHIRGLVGYGVDTEGKLDRDGLYYPYTGGEMTLNLFIQASKMEEAGVTVLLFLNGQPQPYTLEGSENAYMHTVYPKDINDNIFSISFTPAVGTAGEMVELCILFWQGYGYEALGYYEDTFEDTRFFMTRIKLEQMPPEAQLPQVKERVLSLKTWNSDESFIGRSIGSVDHYSSWELTYDTLDTLGNVITDQGQRDRRRFYLKLGKRFSIPANEEYVLTVFVDDQPVVIDGKALSFQVTADQTLVAEFELDCTGLEYMLFAILLEKNCSGNAVGWETYPNMFNRLVLEKQK